MSETETLFRWTTRPCLTRRPLTRLRQRKPRRRKPRPNRRTQARPVMSTAALRQGEKTPPPAQPSQPSNSALSCQIAEAPTCETRTNRLPGGFRPGAFGEMVEAERARHSESHRSRSIPTSIPRNSGSGHQAGNRSDRTAVVGHAGILLAQVAIADARPRNRAGSLQVAGNRHHAGDPKVAPLLQRVTSSIDPFEDVVTAFKRDKALSRSATILTHGSRRNLNAAPQATRHSRTNSQPCRAVSSSNRMAQRLPTS
jgi:hypothetical protein